MNIGDKIKKARKNAGLSQKELAEKMGVSAQMISMYETGQRNPKFDTIKKFSEALNVYISDILDSGDWSKYLEEIKQDWTPILKYGVRDDLLALTGYKLVVNEEDAFIGLQKNGELYEITQADLDELQNSTIDFFKFKLNDIISKSRIIKAKEG